MRVRKQKIDPSSILNRTYFAKQRVEKTIKLAGEFKKDPRKKERMEKGECPVCFYLNSRVGGAMICTVQCALCDEVMQFGNTCTDVLCQKCAKRTGLCRHCGSDMNLKQRRKFDFLNQETK